MGARIAIVDSRPDMLAFLKERIEQKGFEVVVAFTEAEADAIQPPPDVILVDFEPQVDLDAVYAAIREGLNP